MDDAGTGADGVGGAREWSDWESGQVGLTRRRMPVAGQARFKQEPSAAREPSGSLIARDGNLQPVRALVSKWKKYGDVDVGGTSRQDAVPRIVTPVAARADSALPFRVEINAQRGSVKVGELKQRRMVDFLRPFRPLLLSKLILSILDREQHKKWA